MNSIPQTRVMGKHCPSLAHLSAIAGKEHVKSFVSLMERKIEAVANGRCLFTANNFSMTKQYVWRKYHTFQSTRRLEDFVKFSFNKQLLKEMFENRHKCPKVEDISMFELNDYKFLMSL